MISYTIDKEKYIVRAILKDSKSNKTYVASAKCHPDDEYIEEYGMLLAKKRVLVKYQKDFINKLKSDLDYYKQFVNSYCTIEKEYNNAKLRLKKLQNDLYNC